MKLLSNPRLIEEEILKDSYDGILVIIIYKNNYMDNIIFHKLDKMGKEYHCVDIFAFSKKTINKLDPGIGINLYKFKSGILIKHIKEFKEISILDEILD